MHNPYESPQIAYKRKSSQASQHLSLMLVGASALGFVGGIITTACMAALSGSLSTWPTRIDLEFSALAGVSLVGAVLLYGRRRRKDRAWWCLVISSFAMLVSITAVQITAELFDVASVRYQRELTATSAALRALASMILYTLIFPFAARVLLRHAPGQELGPG